MSRVLARAGISKLSDLQLSEPVVRYEHASPGDLLHIDTKKLGRIERLPHRITGNPCDTTDGAAWEFLFVGVDDHARLGFTQMHRHERGNNAAAFLRAAVVYFASLGITVRRVLIDNGARFRTKRFRNACRRIARKRTARSSGSYSRRCASGFTGFPTTIPASEQPCSSTGPFNTIGTGRIRESAASLRSAVSAGPVTTSCTFTARRPQ